MMVTTRSKRYFSNENKNGFISKTTKKARKETSKFVQHVASRPNTRSQRLKSSEQIENKSEAVPRIEEKKEQEKQRRALKKLNSFHKSNDFDVGSIVLAKQKYSVPWPSRVVAIRRDIVTVYFFGDKRQGDVSIGEIYDFKKSLLAIKEIVAAKKKPRDYLIGIREIELVMKVSPESSLLNDV